MSFLSGLFAKTGAPGQAAGQQEEFSQQAIEAIQSQFGETKQNLAPFLAAGTGAVPGVEEAATIGGFGERLKQLFSGGALDPLIEERGRAVQGQLSAGGLTRSGTALQEAARVPTDLVFMIENLLSGRGSNLFGKGLEAATAEGSFGAQAAGREADILSGIGESTAAGTLGTAQAKAAKTKQLLQGAGTIASLFFSDPSLKENVEQIGEVKGLKVYQWDWIERAKGTMIGKCGTIGFMADQVREKFPEFVHKFAGYDIVDYDGLLNKLEAA